MRTTLIQLMAKLAMACDWPVNWPRDLRILTNAKMPSTTVGQSVRIPKHGTKLQIPNTKLAVAKRDVLVSEDGPSFTPSWYQIPFLCTSTLNVVPIISGCINC